MKIDSASLQMASTHASLQHREVSESLRMWVGQRRPDFAGEASNRPPRELVSLSDAGKAAQAADAVEGDPEAAVEDDPKLVLIRQMLELWLGHAVEVFDGRELHKRMARAADSAGEAPRQPPSGAGYGVEYDRHESYTEIEQTTFAASGTVKTADGREISFQLELSMARSYHEESNVSIRLGDAARKTDPLVLNFSGTAAQLSNQRFAFDLNADGEATEKINFVAPGSGFLVFDRNADGKINDGSELFGPSTNDGFAELAQLDDDSNGWIDENDAAFAQLQIWSRNAASEDSLQSLTDAGVGAIALNRLATPFDIKTNANELMGQVRSTGIFLQEDGTAGTIQQIDLTA